jgi:hypothetical protein
MSGRKPEQKVRAGLLNEQHMQGQRCDLLEDSLKIQEVWEN